MDYRRWNHTRNTYKKPDYKTSVHIRQIKQYSRMDKFLQRGTIQKLGHCKLIQHRLQTVEGYFLLKVKKIQKIVF